MLASFIRNRTVLQAIRGHHERYDGQGYPDGLQRNQIPLLARLLTIADCFDAMTSSRSYKKASSPAEAIAHLREGAGTQFDPTLVAVFIDALTRGPARLGATACAKQTQYVSQVPCQYFFHGEARTSPSGAPSAADVKL